MFISFKKSSKTSINKHFPLKKALNKMQKEKTIDFSIKNHSNVAQWRAALQLLTTYKRKGKRFINKHEC